MKKLLSAMLALSMIFALAACNNGDGLVPDAESTTVGASDSTTVGDSDGVTTAPGDTQPSTGESATDDTALTTAYSPDPVSGNTMPSGTKVEVTTDKNGMPVNSNLERLFGNILKGDKYTMKFKIQVDKEDGTGSETLPVTASVWGKQTALETSMALDKKTQIKITLLAKDEKLYAMIPAASINSMLPTKLPSTTKGVYFTLPADSYDNLFPDVLSDEDVKYSGTTKVTHKGVDYICESYYSNGTTTRYYFNSNQLKRIEVIERTGTVSILEDITLTNTVNADMFKIPKGYVDFSMFSGLLGM